MCQNSTVGDRNLLIISLDGANDGQVNRFSDHLSQVLPDDVIVPIVCNYLVEVQVVEIGGKSITFVTGEDLGDEAVKELQDQIDERLPEGSNPVIVGNIPIEMIQLACK